MYRLQLFDALTGIERNTLPNPFDNKEEVIDRCQALNKRAIENKLTILFRVISIAETKKNLGGFFNDEKEAIDWEDSIVDWKIHTNFFTEGKCFVCGRTFSKVESKLKGIGPVCGGWTYSDDKIDWQHVFDKMVERGYYRSIEKLNTMFDDLVYLGKHNAKSILVLDKASNRRFTLPLKGTIHANGVLWVARWVREIYWRNG